MSLLTLLFPGGLNTSPVNVTSTLRFQSTSTQAPTALLPGSPTSASVPQVFTSTFKTNGFAADQVDRIYSLELPFVPNTPQVLDLTALPDLYGTVRSFARVRRITLKFRDFNDGDVLTLGYATTTANAWTGWFSNPGQLYVYPSTTNNDGFTMASAPNTTAMPVSSSSRLLKFDPGGAGFTVDVEILGASQ